MGFLILFIFMAVAVGLAWLKIPAFREGLTKLLTAKDSRVTEKRIDGLEKLLKSEEEKTSVMVKRSEEVEAVRKKALELEGRIKEQRKKQAEAQQKIKGA